MNRHTQNIFLIGALALGLSACTPTIANRGQMIEAEKIASVQPGLSSREDVIMLLGSPTQVSTFDENVWYYFGRSTQQKSFFSPEVIDQQAITVQFDEAGVVKSIQEEDPKIAKNIQPINRRTPTYGRKTTFIEQIIGNVGRAGAAPRK